MRFVESLLDDAGILSLGQRVMSKLNDMLKGKGIDLEKATNFIGKFAEDIIKFTKIDFDELMNNPINITEVGMGLQKMLEGQLGVKMDDVHRFLRAMWEDFNRVLTPTMKPFVRYPAKYCDPIGEAQEARDWTEYKTDSPEACLTKCNERNRDSCPGFTYNEDKQSCTLYLRNFRFNTAKRGQKETCYLRKNGTASAQEDIGECSEEMHDDTWHMRCKNGNRLWYERFDCTKAKLSKAEAAAGRRGLKCGADGSTLSLNETSLWFAVNGTSFKVFGSATEVNMTKSARGYDVSVNGTAVSVNGTAVTINGTALNFYSVPFTVNGSNADINGTKLPTDGYTSFYVNGTLVTNNGSGLLINGTTWKELNQEEAVAAAVAAVNETAIVNKLAWWTKPVATPEIKPEEVHKAITIKVTEEVKKETVEHAKKVQEMMQGVERNLNKLRAELEIALRMALQV